MSRGGSIWAIKPCVISGWSFPGLMGCVDPNNDGAWADLADEIGRHLAQLQIRANRRCLTASVRLVADLANQEAIETLVKLANELEKS